MDAEIVSVGVFNLTVQGKIIEVTGSHVFMLEDGAWRAAENLNAGDKK